MLAIIIRSDRMLKKCFHGIKGLQVQVKHSTALLIVGFGKIIQKI